MGGAFSNYGGTSRNGVARINWDGSLDSGFHPGTAANGVVRAIEPLDSGKYLVGGDFTTFNGINRNGIVILDEGGSVDMAFDPGSGANGTIWAARSYKLEPGIQLGGVLYTARML